MNGCTMPPHTPIKFKNGKQEIGIEISPRMSLPLSHALYLTSLFILNRENTKRAHACIYKQQQYMRFTTVEAVVALYTSKHTTQKIQPAM